ncbi:MAG: hypothetical protein P8Z80_20325 [Pseudolabrys sp.]
MDECYDFIVAVLQKEKDGVRERARCATIALTGPRGVNVAELSRPRAGKPRPCDRTVRTIKPFNVVSPGSSGQPRTGNPVSR